MSVGNIPFGSCQYFNQIFVLSYYSFSSTTYFKCWHLGGAPGCNSVGKESTYSPKTIALRTFARHSSGVASCAAAPSKEGQKRA
jgi:hypothetical protein